MGIFLLPQSFIAFLLTISSLVLFSFGMVHHCLSQDEFHMEVCTKCEIGYLLNQSQTSCEEELPPRVPSTNCIQISDLGECMRCDCSFSLSKDLGICVESTSLLIGCEIYSGEYNTCLRPKADYLIIKENEGNVVSLLFAGGSHCEIFEISEGTCIQCHSGFIIDAARKCHRFTSHRIINEFYSYFSPNGELYSRSLQFIPFSDHGVFQVITHCSVYGNQYGDLFDTLKCQECSSGKSLNQSRTLCVKQPFELCRVVSDTDHSSCLECIYNNQFYLSTNESSKQQACLPRQQFDPTVRCLEYKQDSQVCLSCPVGLFATSTGCSLEKWPSEDQDIRQISDDSYLKLISVDYNCELWITASLCGQCRKGMLVNSKGYCQENYIEFCLIPHDQGGCARCISLMFYNENQNGCTPITNANQCSFSLGIFDKCEQCLSNSYLVGDSKSICEFTGIQNCKISSGFEKNCDLCLNLYYLNFSQKCLIITNIKHCILSDGLTNQCLLCKSNRILSDDGECISQVYHKNGICVDPMYYVDSATDKCVAYDFQNMHFCFILDPHQNRCLECYSGYFIQSNFCVQIQHCFSSDGILKKCYQTRFSSQFITEKGEVSLINPGQKCFTNRIESTCLNCTLQSGEQGIIVEDFAALNDINIQDSSCISKEKHDNQAVLIDCYALQYNKTENQFFCALCKNLHFPDQNGICTSIADTNCEVSYGRSSICSLCKKNYAFNETTNSCSLKDPLRVILFCEQMQEQHCVQCKNLYYIRNHFLCLPLSDPDCAQSDGIDDFCRKCKNGLDLNQNGFYDFKTLCGQFYSLLQLTEKMNDIEHSWVFDQEKNTLAKSEEESQENNPNNQLSKTTTQILHDSQCREFGQNFFFCSKCNEGFSIEMSNFMQDQCRYSYLSHCEHLSTNKTECERCAEGYSLNSSKQCIFMEGCLMFDKVCLKCYKEYFLKEGQCVKLRHCLQQIEGMCLECEPGYFMERKKDQGKSRGENKEELDREVKLKSFCVRIPHCAESDGIRESCLRCSYGYEIINSICLKIRWNLVQFDACEEFSSEKKCIRCKNLFYLEDSQCFELKVITLGRPSVCQRNNGIDKQCELCSFEGFVVDSEVGCQLLDFCEVSNGVNQCIICKMSYMVDLKGKCVRISKQIDNCELYFSYNQTENAVGEEKPNELPQDEVQEVDKDTQTLNSNSQESKQPSSSMAYQNAKERQSCYKCSPLFHVDNLLREQCLQLPHENLNKCQFSNGISSFCSVCITGFIKKCYQKEIHEKQSCQPVKKAIKLMNLGCEIVSEMNRCLKCFESFFLGADSHCLIRTLETKCDKFHPRKDECLECRSGYQLIHITEHFIEKVICLKLSVQKEVENCSEYYPNTNKCRRCIKRIKSNVLEYYLNEKENICEDVLRFMCRTINPQDKTCRETYIENCKIYNQNSGIPQKCLECLNGYYLGYKQIPNETNQAACIQHRNIKNCQIFSQESPDTCLECEPQFFLKSQNSCMRISTSNCKIVERYQDRCSLCNEKFAVDHNNRGDCRESQIDNCIEFEGQFTKQICKKCKENYSLSEVANKCLLRLIDVNCKLYSNIDINECRECNQDYILTKEGNCLHINSSCLPSQNCLKYKEDPQNMKGRLCEQCKTGYFIDENFKCVTQLQDKLAPLNNGGETNNTKEETENMNVQLWMFGSLIAAMLAVCVGLILKKKTTKIKNIMQTSSQKEEINSFAESKRINSLFLNGRQVELCQEGSILDNSGSFSASRDIN